jgi:hypothetical protein
MAETKGALPDDGSAARRLSRPPRIARRRPGGRSALRPGSAAGGGRARRFLGDRLACWGASGQRQDGRTPWRRRPRPPRRR